MKNKATILLLLLSCWIGLQAQESPENTFQRANTLYQEGKFDLALKRYNTLKQAGFESPEFHYNIGNTYYRLDSLGKAVLHYERGLRLSPKDNKLQNNLDFARKGIEHKADTYPLIFYKQWLVNIINTLGALWWFVLAVALVWLGLFMAYRFLYSKGGASKRQAFFAAVALTSISFLMLIFALTKYYWETQRNYAVTVNEIVTVKTAPSAESQTQFKLSPGNKVKIQESFEGWTKILLEDGKEGWMPSPNLEVI